MKIDVVWSEPQYLSHMESIFEALPDRLRGSILPRCQPGEAVRPPMGHIAMVAGWQDVAPLRGLCPMIFVEHGAGQTYEAGEAHNPSYSGSGGFRHKGVIAFIAPSDTVAARWTTAPAVAVGSPKMDRWIGCPSPKEATICFAWHWPAVGTAPEARSAFDHYRARLPEIVDLYTQMGFRVVGHEHPKWRGKMAEFWSKELNVPVLASDVDVFEQASILMVDNSSLAYEVAMLGRPVVSLNAPWYRRDVDHGLRFWSHVPGIMVDGPDDLLGLNPWDLLNDTEIAHMSATLAANAVEHAYKFRDGSSSARAAAFITGIVDAV